MEKTMTKKKEKQCEGFVCELRKMTDQQATEFIRDMRALFDKYVDLEISFSQIYGAILAMTTTQYLIDYKEYQLDAIQNINTAICHGIELFKEFENKEQSND